MNNVWNLPSVNGHDGVPRVDLAALGGEFSKNPYPVYAKLRMDGPVHPVLLPGRTPAWLIVGYEEGRAALADPRLSKEWNNASPEIGLRKLASGRHMLHSDPPRHTRLRKLIVEAFTPRRVASLAPRIQKITDELLDQMLEQPDDTADLVESLAFPLPIAVICELLGVPVSDRETIREWSRQFSVQEDSVQQATRYITALLADKRRHPDEGLLSALIAVTDEDGGSLSDEELVGMVWLLLVAGHETTVNLIANGVFSLLTHPEQLTALREEPGLVDNVVEEVLRYESPLKISTYRFTTEPFPVGDTLIPGGGEIVVVALGDAHHDPARFACPHQFDIHRDARGHLAFGHGIHYCLGAPLARLEGRIALGTLLERCPQLRLAVEPEDVMWRPGVLMRGPEQLPVRLRSHARYEDR